MESRRPASILVWGVCNCFFLSVWAQLPAPRFETAAVHHVAQDQRPIPSQIETAPERLVMHNTSLSECILWAFDLDTFQLDGPAWMASERYDITASAGQVVTTAQLRLMLQSLLADRFRLAVHVQDRSLPGFVMTVMRGGPKLKPSLGEREGVIRGSRILKGDHASIKQLAALLSQALRGPVEDHTNLSGAYDFNLDLTEAIRIDPNSDNPIGDIPSRFADAVRDQLGLALKREKVTLVVTVIDHLEKTPTEN